MSEGKVMRLVDPSSGTMECRICGARHCANIRPDSNGRYYPGAWQCPEGCRLDGPRQAEPREPGSARGDGQDTMPE